MARAAAQSGKERRDVPVATAARGVSTTDRKGQRSILVTTMLLMQASGPWSAAGAAVLVYLAAVPTLCPAPVVRRAVGRVGVMVVARILDIFIAAKAVAFFRPASGSTSSGEIRMCGSLTLIR